jgi:dTMP kinase
LPDRTVLLVLGTAEAAGRRGEPDRIEAEGDTFHRRVADGFDAAARRFPERIAVVDASGTPGQVSARVREAVGL